VFSEGSGQSQGQARVTPNPDDPSSPSRSPPSSYVQKRRLGVVNSQGKENPLRDRGGNYLSTISLDNSNMFLREKYNSELSRRREYFKKTSGRYSDRETGLPSSLSKYQEEGNEDDEESIECPFARYEPPANAPIDSLTNPSSYWSAVNETRMKVERDVTSPWYDASLLLQRLRRFEDMKLFLDYYKEIQLKQQGASATGGVTSRMRGRGAQIDSAGE
jgi:hypothetical protein